jgi:hypothetical protein
LACRKRWRARFFLSLACPRPDVAQDSS